MSTIDKLVAELEFELTELRGKADRQSERRAEELQATLGAVRLLRPKVDR